MTLHTIPSLAYYRSRAGTWQRRRHGDTLAGPLQNPFKSFLTLDPFEANSGICSDSLPVRLWARAIARCGHDGCLHHGDRPPSWVQMNSGRPFFLPELDGEVLCAADCDDGGGIGRVLNTGDSYISKTDMSVSRSLAEFDEGDQQEVHLPIPDLS